MKDGGPSEHYAFCAAQRIFPQVQSILLIHVQIFHAFASVGLSHPNSLDSADLPLESLGRCLVVWPSAEEIGWHAPSVSRVDLTTPGFDPRPGPGWCLVRAALVHKR